MAKQIIKYEKTQNTSIKATGIKRGTFFILSTCASALLFSLGTTIENLGDRQSAMQSSGSPSFKKQLMWQEPKCFRELGLNASRKSMFRIIGLSVCSALVFIGIANWFGLGTEITWKLMIATCGIIIICLLLLVSAHLVQNTVKITDKAIVIIDFSDTPTVYKFKAIDHCEIGNMLVENKTYSVLVTALKNGDREIIGVAPPISKDVLRLTLEQRGVNVVTSSDTLSERSLADEN